MKIIKKILVPIDGSVHARSALDYAETIALACKAEIILLAVVDIAAQISTFEQIESTDNSLQKSILLAKQTLADLQKSISEDVQTYSLVRDGNVREVITYTAAEQNCDLIIMGKRGLGMIKGLLIGSVSSYVSSEAPCPVMTVK